MKKTRFSLGGTPNDNVPATRQNISQRTPSGVRPIASPVIPVGSGVQGAMKHGGELKSMKKKSVKKMAFGGPAGQLTQQRGGGVDRGGVVPMPTPAAPGSMVPGRGGGVYTRGPGEERPLPPGLTGPGGPPRGQGFGGGPGMAPMPAGGGFSTDPNNPTRLQGVDRRTLGPSMGPGAGGMPIGGGFPGGRLPPDGIGPMPINRGGIGTLPVGPAPYPQPGMKKGGKVKMMGKGGSAAGAALREAEMSKLDRKTQSAYDKRDDAEHMRQFFSDYYGPDVLERPSVLKNDLKKGDDRIEDEISSSLKAQGKAARGMKKGGKVSASSYNDMTGGAGGGIGRLEKTSIASKTKSQKLKKGGKVKGYADGGELSLGDRIALERAGVDPYAGTRSDAALAAYRARQDAREKNARKGKSNEPTYASQRAAQPGPDVDVYADARRDRGKGGGRGGPAAGGEAQMREMGLYPFGSRSNNVGGVFGPATDNSPSSPYAGAPDLTSNRGKGGGRGGPRTPTTTKTRDGVTFRLKPDNEDRQTAMEDFLYGKPFKEVFGTKATGKKKGGKVEAFEGTAKDMAEDKKLAKKRGMSLKDWEASAADEKHDAQRNMKGLKKGGRAKKMKGGGSTDPYTDLAARKEVRAKGKAPDFATAFFGPSIRSSSDTRANLREIGRRTGVPDTRNQEDTKAGKMSGMKKGGKASAHAKGCNCMACGGMAKYAMGGKVSTSQTGMKTPLRPKPTAMAKGGAVKSGKTFGKPLPGTKTVGPIRSTTATGANMKKDGMKGQLRAKASGAKPTNMMKPLGMTKMASGGKVRGAGIAQRGTKFIGEV